MEYYERTSDKRLEDILDDLVFSLTEHNLRIIDQLHIGQAVRLRGNNDFPDYEVIMYCSITFAEKMLSSMPTLVNACPGKITVSGRNGRYLITATLWPENIPGKGLHDMMSGMNQTIKDVVDYSTEHWLTKNENKTD